MRALVVASRREHHHLFAIGDAEDRELRAFERSSTTMVAPLRPNRLSTSIASTAASDSPTLVQTITPLPRARPSALTATRPSAVAGPRPGRPGLGEDLELGGGDVRALHQRFRERLARFDASRAAVRAEDVEAGAAQRVAHAGVDRRLGPEDHEPEPLALGEVDDAYDVGGADRDVARHAAGAAIAGRAVDALDELRLHAFPHERVLASPGPDDKDLHRPVYWSMARATGVTTWWASPQSTASVVGRQ